jgi:uncharacterized protein (DUF58 family)
MMRALIRTGCVSLLMFGVLCGTALANTRSGNQNPDLVVTASIGPNHLDVGQRSYWAVTVTNTTSMTLNVRERVTFSTPDFGSVDFVEGPLSPGQSFVIQRSFRARSGGRYVLTARARDKNGVSHTRAAAVA